MIAASRIEGDDELLTRDEVARMLKVSSHTLACWRSAGRGPAVTKLGTGRSAAARYRRSDIERYLADPLRAEAEAGEPWRAARRQAAARARAAAAEKTPTPMKAKTRPAARGRRSRAR